MSYGILNSLKNGQSDSYIKLLDADGIFSMIKPLLDSHNNSKREVEQKNWWNSKKEIEKMPTL